MCHISILDSNISATGQQAMDKLRCGGASGVHQRRDTLEMKESQDVIIILWRRQHDLQLLNQQVTCDISSCCCRTHSMSPKISDKWVAPSNQSLLLQR